MEVDRAPEADLLDLALAAADGTPGPARSGTSTGASPGLGSMNSAATNQNGAADGAELTRRENSTRPSLAV